MVIVNPELRKVFIKSWTEAIRDNNLSLVKKIIADNKLNPNFENCSGAQDAAWYGHIDLLEYFLSFINNSDHGDYCSLRSVLRLACVKQHEDCIKLIAAAIKSNLKLANTDNSEWDSRYLYMQYINDEVEFLKDKNLEKYIPILV
jgi:hypothetical protein